MEIIVENIITKLAKELSSIDFNIEDKSKLIKAYQENVKDSLEVYLKNSTSNNAMWLAESTKKLDLMHQELKPLREKRQMIKFFLSKEE